MADNRCPNEQWECSREIKSLKADIRRLRNEIRMWKKTAEAWMHDCDKLKAKYEPTTLVCSEE